METPNTSTGTRGWIVAERNPQHGCELPPSWLADTDPAELAAQFAHDPDDDLPVCEWCGRSVDQFTTLAFVPCCSAECQGHDEFVWECNNAGAPHTSPDE